MFESLGRIDYTDGLQCDGAYSVSHINYGKAPEFNGVNGREIASGLKIEGISIESGLEGIIRQIHSFDGTEKGYSSTERLQIWKHYWLEYIHAFDALSGVLPNSIVTVYVGRQAVEMGFKYLLLERNGTFPKTHDLGKLAHDLLSEPANYESYMEWVEDFCNSYCGFIEGGNSEYFRFPEYKGNSYFAGNCLDIPWLSYNLAIVVLKLVHLAGLDDELSASEV